MPNILRKSDKGKEKVTSSSGSRFDVVRSQRQPQHEKQLSGTQSKRRAGLTSSSVPVNDFARLKIKEGDTSEKEKNTIEAISERRYRRISSLASVRDFAGSRVQEKRRLRGGMENPGESSEEMSKRHAEEQDELYKHHAEEVSTIIDRKDTLEMSRSPGFQRGWEITNRAVNMKVSEMLQRQEREREASRRQG